MRLKIKTATGRTTQAVLRAIAEARSIDVQVKEMQERSRGIKARIKEGFEAEKLTKLEGEDFNVTYVAGTTKVSLDSKLFKKEQLEMFKKYAKSSNSAGYVKIS